MAGHVGMLTEMVDTMSLTLLMLGIEPKDATLDDVARAQERLIEQRDAGRGVLLVSLELEEIRSLSDRVLVIYDGRIVAELAPESSEEDFGMVMTGGGRQAA